MEYNDFHSFEPYDSPPRKKGMALTIVVVVAVCLIVLALVASLVVPGIINGGNLVAQQTPSPQPTPGLEPAQTRAPAQLPPIGSGAPPVISSDNPVVDIVEKVGPAVVSISSTSRRSLYNFGYSEGTSTGSGIIISENGYIVTNNHVVEGGANIIITLNTGEEIKAEIVGHDQTSDVAVLKINKTGLTAAVFGDSDKVRVGEQAVAIGNALGYGETVTVGYISAKGRTINIYGQNYEYMQTDAAINPGNSGGALVNILGEVIGINSAKQNIATVDAYGNAVSAEGIGFALPINSVKPLIEELIQFGSVVRPGIGVIISELDAETAEEFDVPPGLFIESITDGGPAAEAQLREGDIITKLNGKQITDQEEFTSQIQSKKVGELIELEIFRNNRFYVAKLIVADLNEIQSNESTWRDWREESEEPQELPTLQPQ